MSFKAIINNMAKENNVVAQSVLQTYIMLERLLNRYYNRRQNYI